MDDVRISLLETTIEPYAMIHQQIIPTYAPDGTLLCVKCNAPVTERPDNPTFSQPDWWDCPTCGSTGAFLHPHWPGVSQNGVPLIGYSRLF